MLTVSLLGLVVAIPTIAMTVIGLIERITYLTKTDEDFYHTYAIQRKEWF
jgi:hypothetical protein